MRIYDAEKEIDRDYWLELAESEQISEVMEYHENIGTEIPDIEVHSAMHVAVENQIIQEYQPTIDAIARLQRQGLERHEAVHAVAAIVIEISYDLINNNISNSDKLLASRINKLSAKRWLKGKY